MSLKVWGCLDGISNCSNSCVKNVVIENVKNLIDIVVEVYNYMVERI